MQQPDQQILLAACMGGTFRRRPGGVLRTVSEITILWLCCATYHGKVNIDAILASVTIRALIRNHHTPMTKDEQILLAACKAAEQTLGDIYDAEASVGNHELDHVEELRIALDNVTAAIEAVEGRQSN